MTKWMQDTGAAAQMQVASRKSAVSGRRSAVMIDKYCRLQTADCRLPTVIPCGADVAL
jgi:hypothetical protein